MRVEAGHLCQSVKHNCFKNSESQLVTLGRRGLRTENRADGSDMASSEKDIWPTTARVEKKPEASGKEAEQGCFEHL